MQSAPALPLEKLAAIDAKLQAGLPRDRVFAEAGVTAETWERAKDAWFARMANEAARGKGRKLHKRYHDLLRAARNAADSEDGQTLVKPKGKAPKPPVARLSPLAAQYRPDAPRVSSSADVADSPSGLLRAPGFVAATPAIVTPARESSPGGDGLTKGLPFGGTSTQRRADDALPFTTRAAVPTNEPAQRPATRSRKETISFDMPVDEEHTILHTGNAPAVKSALPFVAKQQAQTSWDETTEPVRSPLRNDPLPFVAAKQRPPASAQASPPRTATGNDVLPFVNPQHAASSSSVFAAPAKKPTVPPPLESDPLASTHVPNPSTRGDVLPFASGGSTSAVMAAPTNPAKATGLPFQQPTSRSASSPSPSSPPPPQNVPAGLPFQKAPTPVSPSARPSSPAPPLNTSEPLDLTRYACLCAELARFPDETERVFARYGLTDPNMRATVDATWRARLGQDPQLYRTWQEYYQHYSTQYFGQGRKI